MAETFVTAPTSRFRASSSESTCPATASAASAPSDLASAGTAPLLSVRQVEKVYGGRDSLTRALAGVSFDVFPGEFVGLMGPSGSGKTTLLNCIATIDSATSGHILLGGRDVTSLKPRELSAFRRDELGFVFQDSNLLDTLTAFENIALALTIKGEPTSSVRPKVEVIAQKLGVFELLGKYPHQMSGGQKQRVAAARAMVSDPTLVLADEPTGALDSKSAGDLLDALSLMNEQLGATIMMVTHDSYAASFSQRVLFVKDGDLFNELRRGNESRAQFFGRIMDVVTFLGGEVRDAR